MSIIEDLNSETSELLLEAGAVVPIKTGTMEQSSLFLAIVDSDSAKEGVSDYPGTYRYFGEIILDPSTGDGWIDPVSGEEIIINGNSYVVEDCVNDNGLVYIKYVLTRT